MIYRVSKFLFVRPEIAIFAIAISILVLNLCFNNF